MSEFFLRPANKSDTPAIYDLIREGRINPLGLDWKRFILAQTEDGEVVGCGQIKPHRDGSKELASFAVTQSWQGRGVARAIIEYLIESIECPMYLMCVSKMKPMYEKFGFRVLDRDEMPKYFQRLNRLARFVEPLRKQGQKLLVMIRD